MSGKQWENMERWENNMSTYGRIMEQLKIHSVDRKIGGKSWENYGKS